MKERLFAAAGALLLAACSLTGCGEKQKTLTVFNEQSLKGIMDGCAAVKWPYATTVESLLTHQPSPLTPRIYDMEGHRLSQVPAKGLYIVNGRKVIIK